MHFYMSGTPVCDDQQGKENALCSHRLFSLHGSYQRNVMKWLSNLKDDLAADPATKYPRTILLDSGAFTAWKSGHVMLLEDLKPAYQRFLDEAGDLFDKIWMINLDKIPGEPGRAPSMSEISEALDVSDKNYVQLVDTFGDRILPVFHHGESIDRLFECVEMVKDRSWYICVAPRNDFSEKLRCEWAKNVHKFLHAEYPQCRTHGLATTGNKMMLEIPWFSVDSAAWILHAAFGLVDVFHGDKYRAYFMSYEGDKHTRGEKHYDTCPPAIQAEIKAACARYGLKVEDVKKKSRGRSLICMGEMLRYLEWATTKQAALTFSGQPGLLDVL